MVNNLNRIHELSVLIVDGNKKMRDMIHNMIEQQFKNKINEITDCNNGKEAVEYYKKIMPTWVIMDIKMPVMDGMEASKIILSHYPKAKIIILTQYDDIEYYEIAQKIGLTAFVQKENLSDVPILMKDIL
jgi:two-component system, response regulator YesN